MIMSQSGVKVAWDYQVGTFTGQLGDLRVGLFAGEILTVSDLETALGVVLTAQEGADLQEAYLAHPYTALQRPVSKLEFMDLFRPDDLIKIYTAAKSSVDVQIQLERMRNAPGDTIDLNDLRTLNNLQMLEAVGLLTKGDADRISKGVSWET